MGVGNGYLVAQNPGCFVVLAAGLGVLAGAGHKGPLFFGVWTLGRSLGGCVARMPAFPVWGAPIRDLVGEATWLHAQAGGTDWLPLSGGRWTMQQPHVSQDLATPRFTPKQAGCRVFIG